jgi:plasmid stability protein
MEVRKMADLRIENIPEDMLHALKVRAAQERTTVKALVLEGCRRVLAGKGGKV